MSEILKCEGLTKRYSGGCTALSDINLTCESGRIIGLMGPNGSGKTTLIKLAEKLLVPTSGSITVAGMTPGVETKKIVSYLPDTDFFGDWMKAGDALDYFEDFFGRAGDAANMRNSGNIGNTANAESAESIETAGGGAGSGGFDRRRALDMMSRLGLQEQDRIKQMSKGTREKLQLILAMSRRARLYLLDEPIGGVDPATRDFILHTILANYDENATILISTHLITDVESILDEVIFLNRGQVSLHTTVDDIRKQQGMSVNDYFREVFRCY